MTLTRILVFILLAGIGLTTHAADPKPLELGVIPYLPTTRLISTYQPLRTHLEEKLGRSVTLSTAPDFATFLERCLRKEYDLIVLGPGLGRFAQTEAGYRPLVASKRNIRAVIVVERDTPYASLKDLAGKRVAMQEPMTGISQLGKETFRQAGLLPERDYQVHVVKSPSNALHAVLHQEAEAGVTTNNLVPQLTDDMKKRQRVLAESREIPGLMFMLLPAAREHPGQIRDILLQYEKTEAGRRFIESLALDGLRVPDESEMKAMDGFQPELRNRFRR